MSEQLIIFIAVAALGFLYSALVGRIGHSLRAWREGTTKLAGEILADKRLSDSDHRMVEVSTGLMSNPLVTLWFALTMPFVLLLRVFKAVPNPDTGYADLNEKLGRFSFRVFVSEIGANPLAGLVAVFWLFLAFMVWAVFRKSMNVFWRVLVPVQISHSRRAHA